MKISFSVIQVGAPALKGFRRFTSKNLLQRLESLSSWTVIYLKFLLLKCFRESLEKIQKENPDRFKLWYTVDRPTEGWTYSSGFINEDMIRERLFPVADGKQWNEI